MARFPFSVVILASALCLPAIALAQTAPAAPPHEPLQKTIGATAKTEVVPSLIVFNSRGATCRGISWC
jgi:hypothetical protein